MKTYEELLSDIEEDMELMGTSHIVYSAEENGVITDYDYLPSDLCMTSTTLKELQEKLHEQMLYDKASAYTAGADKNAPKLAVIFPGIGYTADKPLLYYTNAFIITKTNPNLIGNQIISDLNRSYTTWTGESGYKKEPIQVIMTIISKYESQQLKQIVASEDPDAFITYTDHLEIIGNFEKRFDA